MCFWRTSKFQYSPFWVFKLIFFRGMEMSELSSEATEKAGTSSQHLQIPKPGKPQTVEFFHHFQTDSNPANGKLWIEVSGFLTESQPRAALTPGWTSCSGGNLSSCHERLPILALLSLQCWIPASNSSGRGVVWFSSCCPVLGWTFEGPVLEIHRRWITPMSSAPARLHSCGISRGNSGVSIIFCQF